MLLNCTNHPYRTWSAAQREAAVRQFGEVVDFPFPKVDPSWDELDILREAGACAERIAALSPDAVNVAGEFSLVFTLVDRLIEDGYKVVTACSHRNTVETTDENGNNVKTSVFVFERFREYVRWGERD